MHIEMWPIERPRPYHRNPRKNAAAVDKVAESIREFGVKQPLVVDDKGVLIVGHTRLLAMKKLGLTEVPVLVAYDLSPAKVKAYRLADNRVGEEAEWDGDALALELNDLKLDGFDLGKTGFDAAELDAVLNGLATDAKPEDKGGPAPGQVFELVVVCESKAKQRELARRLRKEGFAVDTQGGPRR